VEHKGRKIQREGRGGGKRRRERGGVKEGGKGGREDIG